MHIHPDLELENGVSTVVVCMHIQQNASVRTYCSSYIIGQSRTSAIHPLRLTTGHTRCIVERELDYSGSYNHFSALKAQDQWMWWDRSGLHFQRSLAEHWLASSWWYQTQHIFRYVDIDIPCDVILGWQVSVITPYVGLQDGHEVERPLRKQSRYEHDRLFQGIRIRQGRKVRYIIIIS